MYRPGGDLPQFRQGGLVPVARPPPGVMNMGPSYIPPPPIPGRVFVMPQFSGGLPGFLPPSIPNLSPPLPSGQPPNFVPPLPQSPPAEVPPPPPPSPPPPPLEESSSVESLPPEPPKPSDLEMLENIEVLAAFVVTNGPQFESMARAKRAGDPKFAFLFESDMGHEAVIGHEFYKWRKQALELEFRLDAENKESKNLDQDKSSGHAHQAIRMSGQSVLPKEIPGSPTMSDMDMEDDIAMPTPKREPVGQLRDAKGVENFSKVQQTREHRVLSDGLLRRVSGRESPQTKQLQHLATGNREHPDKSNLLNRSESVRVRLTGERGFIIDESYSDTSDASEDIQHAENVGKTEDDSSDLGRFGTEQDEKRLQGDAILGQAANMPELQAVVEDLDDQVPRSSDSPAAKAALAPQEHQASRWESPQHTQVLYPAEESHSYEKISSSNKNEPFQSGDRKHCGPKNSNSISDASNTPKDSETQASTDRTGDRGLECELSATAAQQHRKQDTATVNEFGRLITEGASDSDYGEDEHLPKRKRRRYSRSRSRSRSSGDSSRRRQSLSGSPRRREMRSRSHSQSPRLQRSNSRSPPTDLRWGGLSRGEGDLRGDCELQERESGGGRGTGSSMCFLYARGRCFRGSSCRFLHQSKKFILNEKDSSVEETEVERLDLEVSTEDLESGGEVLTENKFEVEAAQKSDSAAGNDAEEDEAENMTFDTQTTDVVKAEACTQVGSEEKTEANEEVETVERPEVSTEVGLIKKPELNVEMEETKKTKLSTEQGVSTKAELSSEMQETEKPEVTAEAVFMETELTSETEETEKPEARVEAGLRKPELYSEMEEAEKPPIVTEMVAPMQAEDATERDLAEKPVPKTEVEWSPSQDEFLLPTIPRGQPRQSEAPLPVAGLPPYSPFSQSKSMGQSIPMGSSSFSSQPYMPTSQSYNPGNFALGLHQPNSLQYPLPSTNVPTYAQPSSFRESVNNTNTNLGTNFRTTGNPNAVQPFAVGNQFSGQLTSRNLGPSQLYATGSQGLSQQAFLPGASMYERQALSQSHGLSAQPSYGNAFPAQPLLAQISTPSHQSAVTSHSQPVSFPLNPSIRQQQGILTNSTGTLPSVQHGFSSTFSLPIQQSVLPHPFVGDTSKQFTFTSLKNDGLQDAYSRSLPTLSAPMIQNPMPWMLPGSVDASASPPVSAAFPPKTGQSSSYAYALTTIPPLSSLIKLPGVSDISTSGDQYDPLSDSLDPAPSSVLKTMSYDFVKPAGNGKSIAMSNTIVSHLENVSPGPVMEKANIVFRKPDIFEAEIATINDGAADPGVGIVENVSPPDDNRTWSPVQPVDDTETGQDRVQAKIKKNSRGLKLLRSAVAEYVKEVLKPTWRGGHMSKDAFKTIVKKAVDKVTGTLPSHHIPKSQEKVDQFMASSRSKISKLVQGYVDKYLKA